MNFKSQISKNANGFDALPEDRYTVEITDAQVGLTKSGKEMVKITHTVVDGKLKNRKLFQNIVVEDNPTGEAILYSVMKAAGSPLIEEDDIPATQAASDLKGRRLTIYATPGKTPDGNPTNKLSAPMSIGGTASAASEDATGAAPKKAAGFFK